MGGYALADDPNHKGDKGGSSDMYAIDDRNRHTANKAEYAGYDMQRRPL